MYVKDEYLVNSISTQRLRQSDEEFTCFYCQ